jgi:hypothetical protein
MSLKQVKSFGEFKNQLESNVGLQKEFKEDPLNAIHNFEESNPLWQLITGFIE